MVGRYLGAHPSFETKTGEGSTLLQQTIMAIEAATAALVVITADGVDRRYVTSLIDD